MTAAVAAACLADRIVDEIGAGRVAAALFSTFTFRREFFERVPLPLLTAEGRRRGFLPITVVVDRTQFEGSGWGYEVVRAPEGRRWHAKLIAAMIEQQGHRRTVVAIGSGNLTRSGWERNLELFHVDAWSGWRLPPAVVAWLRTPWLRTSAFAKWARDVRLGSNRRHHQSVLGSLEAPLWHQLDFVRRGRDWSEIHVVSPFGDVDDDERETANACGPFFDHLLDHARSDAARVTVYLRGVDDAGTRAFGDPGLLKRVSKHVDLRLRAVPPEGDRILHAKLLAARANGTWSVLVGSHNATGAAFTREGGNIELGCEFRHVGRVLPARLLPRSRAIALAAVVRPEMAKTKPRWECLESATYVPRRRRIVLRWRKGHGLFDSRVLLENRDLDPDNVNLASVADRFLKTIPLGPTRRKYEPDFVPIEVPDDEADLVCGTATEVMTAEDWLERLDGSVFTDDGPGDVLRGKVGTGGNGVDGAKSQRFHWRERVVTLDHRLRGFDAAIVDALTKREVDHLRRAAIGVWQSHTPDEPELSNEVRAWRRWVRAGLWHVLQRLDQRVGLRRPLSNLARRWRRSVPRSLKEFEVA